MALRISGPGVGLNAPQYLYPSELYNAPYDVANNYVDLAPGEALNIPAGEWLVQGGGKSMLQYLDPISNTWRSWSPRSGQDMHIRSDGFTNRMANLTGCPIAAIVTNGGTSYSQASASITASAGGSLWQAIVGGSLTVSSIVAAGAGFTIRPLLFIPDPPSYAANGYGGVQATGYPAITNGTVSAITMTNVGAGYTSATVVGLLLPSPFEPNAANVTVGTVNFTLTNTGLITAALCTNNGTPLASPFTLTLTPSSTTGTTATLSPVVLQTCTSVSVTAGGVGWGTAANFPLITSVQGTPTSVSAIGNPIVELTGFRPRALAAYGTTNAGGTISAVTIQDGGLFAATPTLAIAPAQTVPTTAATCVAIMGSASDTVLMQPL